MGRSEESYAAPGQAGAKLIDSSGLVPHTQKWLEYWRRWLDNWTNDPNFRPQELMPFERRFNQ